MLRKLVYLFTVLVMSVGMLGTAAPALALDSARSIGTTRALKGTIVAIDTKAHTMTVAPARGARVKVKVAKNTHIVRKGKNSPLGKLRVGDKANLTYNTKTKKANDIRCNPGTYNIHGTIQAINTDAGTLTIASEDGGNSVTLTVDDTTEITRNGDSAALADLFVGDKVKAKYNSATMLASSIRARAEDGEVEGTVSAMDTSANTLTITPQGDGNPENSADVVLNIVESTVFLKDDAVVEFTDVQVGDRVHAQYEVASMNASKVEVQDTTSGDAMVEGTISAIDTDAHTITITQQEARVNPMCDTPVVLNIVDGTVITKNDAVITFGDLQEGDHVYAAYNSVTMNATEVKVEDMSGDSMVEGTVSAVDADANTLAITPDGGGDDVLLNIVDGTVITKDDALISLADVQVGDHAYAAYDSSSMNATEVKVGDSSSDSTVR